MPPLVSVIIPSYNAARFLPEALESVFSQTWPELEVIVVDDGSTDDTEDVVQPWLHRIQYLKKENGGIGSARNAGIEKATGEFTAFLDADDLWLPHKVEKQLGVMNDQSVGLTGSTGGETGTSRTHEVLYKEMLANNPFSASSVLCRRSILDQTGWFATDKMLHGVEDWDMWLRLVRRSKAVYLGEPIVTIRTVEGSVSSLGNSERMFRGELEVLRMQATLPQHLRPSRRLLARAISYRYFCAAWNESMRGKDLQAFSFLLIAFSRYPPHLLHRKLNALFARVTLNIIRGDRHP